MIRSQVKPTRAGSSIGVTVAYGVTDSLEKANALISEVILNLSPPLSHICVFILLYTSSSIIALPEFALMCNDFTFYQQGS